MSSSAEMIECPVLSQAAPSGLFASYELKAEKRNGALFIGYGILVTLVILLVVIPLLMPTVAPKFLQSKASGVDLVAPPLPEPVPERQPVAKVAPPPLPVAKTSPALPEVPSPMRIEAPRSLPRVERAAVIPAPAAPKPAFPDLAALPTKPIARPVYTGSLGETNGVQPQPNKVATRGPALGSFGSPAGTTTQSTSHVVATGAFGTPTASGTGQSGHAVATGAFGTPDGTAVGAPAKAVKSVGFNEATLAKAQPAAALKVSPISPVAILSKPTPVYTEEARRLRIEGSVTMQVVFAASGEVRIVGVIKGLGHGLDEAAAVAARQIRFAPARRDGQSVDYPATIHIVFALS